MKLKKKRFEKKLIDDSKQIDTRSKAHKNLHSKGANRISIRKLQY